MLPIDRRRSRALLGAASAIALAAGLGMAPLKAARAQVQTISASTTFFQVSVDGIGFEGFDIVSPAVVSASNSDPAFLVDVPITEGVSVSLGGAIRSETVDEDSTGLLVDADLEGGISNSQEISASAETDSNNQVVDAHAIEVASGVEVDGGLVNNATGTISAYAGQGTDQPEAEWNAVAVFLREGVEFDGDINNEGLISATAGEIVTLDSQDTVTFDLYADAFGILADGAEIDGDIVNLGTIDADATAFVEQDVEESGEAGDFFSDLTGDYDASAYGVIIESEIGLDGAIDNDGTITADALAGAQNDHSVDNSGEGGSVLSSADVEGSAEAFAAGVIVDQGGEGLDFGGFSNSGWIGADAEARMGVSATADAQDDADASAENYGEADAEAVGVVIELGENLLVGSLWNELGATIQATATAALTADATATSSGETADAEAYIYSGEFAQAEATGFDVRLNALYGDVANDGSVLGEADASLAATASATGSEADAGSYGEAAAEGRGGILIADLIVGDVTVGSTGSVVGSAEASNTAEATAIATGEQTDDAYASAYAGEAEADGIGYYVNVELLTGDFVNEGTILGEAAATSSATATATGIGAGEGGPEAYGESNEAEAEANGAVLVVDALGGGIYNASVDSIAAVASAQSLASATATEGNGGEAIAESGDAEAEATGLLVISDLLGEGLDNSGSITAYASALSQAEATHSSAKGGEADAESEYVHADAEGVVLDVSALVGPVENSGVVGATATGTSYANADNTSGKGGDADADSDYAAGHASGFAIEGAALVGDVTNSGSIAALGEATSHASASHVGETGGEASADSEEADAEAEGLAIFSDSVIGSVSNGESGSIVAEANAWSIASAVGETGKGGEVYADAGDDGDGAEADAAGLRIHGDGVFGESYDGTLIGQVDNAGLIAGMATAGNDASASLTTGTDGYAYGETADADASADGADIESDVVVGEIVNSGTFVGEAYASNSTTASVVSEGGELSEAESEGGYVEAYGSGLDLDVDVFAGQIVNSGLLAGYATASGESVATVVTGDLSDGQADADARTVYSDAAGLDIDADDGFAGLVMNGEGGLIVGAASSATTVRASVLPGEGQAVDQGLAEADANDIEAYVDGILLDVDEGTMIAQVENHGSVVGEASGSVDVEATVVATDLDEGAAQADAFSSGFDFDVDGIDIETNEGFVGEIVNRGTILADSDVHADVTANATADNAKADAGLGEGYVDAAGIEIEGDVFTGLISTGSTIQATADSVTHIAATATGEASGEAVADRVEDIDVRAWGIVFERDSDNEIFTGSIVNELGGLIHARATHVGELTAVATAEDYAEADAVVDDNTDVFAAGIEHAVGAEEGDDGETLIGEIVNDGSIQVAATGEQSLTATATATGEGSASVADADTFNDDLEADAEGFNIEVENILADFANNGSLMAVANADLTATATASADWTADARAYADSIDSDVEGMDLDAGENFTGKVTNGEGALLYAAAQTDVWQTASATSDSADAVGESEVYEAVSNVDGIEIDADNVFAGEVLNQGTIDASAGVDAHIGATAIGETLGEALAENEYMSADSDGIDFNADSALGDILNSGTIFSDAVVLATLSSTATAEPGGTAQAASWQGYGGASAAGIEVSADEFIGDIANSGSTIDVYALGERTITAEATGGADAEAFAGTGEYDEFTVSARGIDLDSDFESFIGDIRNGATGHIDVVAVNDGSMTATASGENYADADADLGYTEALAIGMEVALEQMVGEVVNDGLIEAIAANSQNTSATATATGIGSEANAHAENDGVWTEAIGIGFYDWDGEPEEAILLGDVVNNGTIVAWANGPHSATATATGDNADAYAESFGGSVATGMLLDVASMIGDFANTDAITAVANETGTVTATGESGKGGTAEAYGASGALAYGMEAITPEIFGDIGSGPAGEILAVANADITVESSMSGGEATNEAYGEAIAYAAGIDVHPAGEGEYEEPGAALSWAEGTFQDGRLYNHGSIVAMSTAETTIVSDDVGYGRSLAVSEGIGAIVEAITDGVENSGTIYSSANATTNVAVDGDGFGEARAVSYGILLLGELGEPGEPGEFIQQIQLEPNPPSPLGTIGDLDDSGIAILNTGEVYSTASALGEAVGESAVDATAYASGLQVGRGYDGEVLGDYLPPLGDFVGQGLLVDGDILNTGLLSATASAEGDGFGLRGPIGPDAMAVGLGLYDSIVAGNVDNTDGTILAHVAGESGSQHAIGVHVAGSYIEEALNNTGLIMATVEGEGQADAINTEWAAGETIINLLDGNAPNDQVSDPSIDPKFDGDNPLGIVGDIRLARYFADTINWSGGDIQGDIYGYNDFLALGANYDDVLNVFAGVSDVFDYDGNITGLHQINVNTAAGAGTPVELTLRGITTNTDQLNVNDDGTLVLGAAHPELVGHGEVWVDTYNHADGGTVLFELTPDPDDVGFIVAEEDTTLNIEGGTIGIRPMFGDYLYADETIYEVIYSGERNGTFDDTFSPTPLLDVAVEYGDYDGEQGDGESGPGDVNDIPDFDDGDSDVRLRVSRVAFGAVDGLTPNQMAVGDGIENVFGPDIEGTPFGDAIALLFLLDEEEYPETLSTLHGAEHAQVSSLTDHLASLFHDWLSNRTTQGRTNSQSAGNVVSYVYDPTAEQLAGVEGTERHAEATQLAQTRQADRVPGTFSIWTAGGGLWGSGDGDPANDVVGFDQDTWGVMFGADYQIDRNWLVGLAGSYQDTNADFDDGDKAEIDGFQVGGFVNYLDDSGFYGDGSFSIGWLDYDTSRQVFMGPAFLGNADGETDAFVFTTNLEIGYLWDAGGFLLQPLVGLEYTHASIDGFTETGPTPFNLVVSDRDADSLESRLGFVASTEVALSDSMVLVPEVRAEWRHEFLDTEDDVTSAFVGQPGSVFTAVGNDYGSDSAVVGAGLTLRVTDQIEAFVDYDGRFQSGYEAHAVSGGLRLSW